MESTLHKHLKKLSLYWLKAKMTDLCANEVKLFVRRKKIQADALGINLKRQEARIIEVKSSRSDFLRDEVLHSSYGYHAVSDYTYIMTPEDLLTVEELPARYGLLEVDDYDNITVKKKPTKNPKRIMTLETLLKRTGRAATNAVLFQELSKETKDVTGGKFASNAAASLIHATCPVCKKRHKYLVGTKQEEVECQTASCRQAIPLDKARVHIITKYNEDFYEELSALIKEDKG
ncbi:MmcB family DNA repair protein [Alkalihalobacillus oceani]|uniref:MmcB family DNA repair protein n=1 Tax=Halalkalibacter oceani TaxID=1653776 RepID=A0A9X2DR44_9BACI|nr:MmcB family DNA repair protein [Halalkalibacter oceani]MCM3713907.1 MmcB family DNA repair protein [Halalkalibacter oceani]